MIRRPRRSPLFPYTTLFRSAKYDRQQIGSAVSDAWAGDIGMAIAVFDIMAFGVSVQNLGGDLGGGALLSRPTRAGLTLKDRKSPRLNSSPSQNSYAVFWLTK